MLRSIYFCLFLFVLNAFGQESLVKGISFYKDTTHKETLQSVQSAEFISVKKTILGLNDATFWFKVELQNTDQNQPLIFSVKENSVKNVEVYQNGILLTSIDNSLDATHPALEVTSNNTTPFYLKVNFSRQAYFPLEVYSKRTYSGLDKLHYFTNGFYYGFVVMVFIVNLFFFISLEDRAFLFYCIFLTCINLAISDFDGLSIFYIPNSVALYATILFHYLLAITGALFATSFLDLKRLYFKSVRIGFILSLLPLISYAVYFTTNKYIFYVLGDVFCLLVLLFYWLMGVYVLKKQPSAKFFVIGYSLVLFTALFFAIPQDLGFNIFSLSVNHVKFGALFEMLILTFAITYRVKIMHQENARFTDEIKTHINHIFQLETQLKEQKNLENLEERPIEQKIDTIAKENKLTEREADILLQIVNGLKNQQIADKLFVSVNTIKYHTRNIYEKLDVTKRTEIASKILYN